jgi:hypothetical protein
VQLTNSVAWVRVLTIPTDQPPLVGEASANFYGEKGVAQSEWRIPYGRNLGFVDRSRYFFFQVAPQLYSRDWVDPVPDPLFLRKSGIAGNRTRNSGSVARNSEQLCKIIQFLATKGIFLLFFYMTYLASWIHTHTHTHTYGFPGLQNTILVRRAFEKKMVFLQNRKCLYNFWYIKVWDKWRKDAAPFRMSAPVHPETALCTLWSNILIFPRTLSHENSVI